MPDWQLVVADTAGNLLGELTSAKTRILTFNLDDSCTVTFSIDGDDPQAALIVEGATDLIAYCDGVKKFRGRIGPSTDVLGSIVSGATTASSPQLDGGYTCRFAATCYRGMLARRFLLPGATATFTNVDQAAIVAQLVADSQGHTGGSWGITVPAVSTGVLRSRVYTAGVDLDTTITDLGNTVGGFDWEIDANLSLNIYSPFRGRVAQMALDYGGNVQNVARTLDTTLFANAVFTTGASGLSPVVEEAATFGPAGRWEQAYSDPDINEAATLSQRAAFYLGYDDAPPASYQVVLTDGWWTPDALWLGDVVGLYIRRGRLNVDTAVRVSQVVVNLGDDGGEWTTVTLGPVLVVRADNTIPASSSPGSALAAGNGVVQSPAYAATSMRVVVLDIGRQVKSLAKY